MDNIKLTTEEQKKLLKKRKQKKKILIAIAMVALVVTVAFVVADLTGDLGGTGDGKYVEMLVKTSDNVLSKLPRERWTSQMYAEELSSNGKQGYIVDVKPENWTWGTMERDPKRFAIIRILASEFNESWMESEYDRDENMILQRKYRLPLNAFLNSSEITTLTNIPYGSAVDWSFYKNLTNVQSKVVKTNMTDIISNSLILHGSAGTFTICPVGCSYTSLANWETAEDSDLTGAGNSIATIWEAFNDTTAVTIGGWTTTQADQVIINSTPSARHAGKWVYDLTKYILNVNNADALILSEQFIIIDGIQVAVLNPDGNNDDPIVSGITEPGNWFKNNITIKNCIITGGNSSTYSQVGMNLQSVNQSFNIINNVIWRIGTGGTSNVLYTFGRAEVYNNIIQGGDYGLRNAFASGPNQSIHCKNTIIINQSTGAFLVNAQADNYSNEYCATYDATGDNFGGAGNIINVGVDFVDPHNGDYHLKSDDDNALNAGTNLMTAQNYSFNNDIDYQTRELVWDIGADEYFVVSSTCTYSGLGDWNINCAENCVKDTSTLITNGQINFYGTGSFLLYKGANISNMNKFTLPNGTCPVYIINGSNMFLK